MVPSKERYIKKMLFMLNSLREPFDVESIKWYLTFDKVLHL
jgi:hypothetical protein